MRITKDNLYDVIYENEDARLLIEDVTTNTNTGIYYGQDIEITLAMVLEIWYKVYDDRKRGELRRALPRLRKRYNLLFCEDCDCISEAV